MSSSVGIGDQIGQYRVTRMIGRGGMGVVFEATDERLQRKVALKLLLHQFTTDETSRKRFVREAQALGRVTSPYVVSVYDAGEHDGNLFLVTQFVSGGDLRQHLTATGPMAPAEALGLMVDLTEGITAAHEAGIIHRDIKPSNILISQTGDRVHPFVCDLGIAQLVDVEHTKTVGVLGTLAYLAPERHKGLPASAASDVYSLGCLVWAMLTGRPPYAGDPSQVARGHLSGPVPQLPPAAPGSAALNPLLAAALAKDPGARPASAAEFGRQLTDVVQQLEAPTSISTPMQHVQPESAEATTLRPDDKTPALPPALTDNRRAALWTAAGLVVAVVATTTAIGLNRWEVPAPGAIQDLRVTATGHSQEASFEFEPVVTDSTWASRLHYYWRTPGQAARRLEPGAVVKSDILTDGKDVPLEVFATIDGPHGETAEGPVSTAQVSTFAPPGRPRVSARGGYRSVTITWQTAGSAHGRPITNVQLSGLSSGTKPVKPSGSLTLHVDPGGRRTVRARSTDSFGSWSQWTKLHAAKAWPAPRFFVRKRGHQDGRLLLQWKLTHWRPGSAVRCRPRSADTQWGFSEFEVDRTSGSQPWETFGENGTGWFGDAGESHADFTCEQM